MYIILTIAFASVFGCFLNVPDGGVIHCFLNVPDGGVIPCFLNVPDRDVVPVADLHCLGELAPAEGRHPDREYRGGLQVVQYLSILYNIHLCAMYFLELGLLYPGGYEEMSSILAEQMRPRI